MIKHQTGVTTVEFAIVATALFTVVFGIIELARVLYTWNTLNEMTRRATRVAVVCPINHSAIQRVALFNSATDGGASAIAPGVEPENISVEYLDEYGEVMSVPMASQVAYVRVSVVNYQHKMFIPFVPQVLSAPRFATTLPRESLGYADGESECYGTST